MSANSSVFTPKTKQNYTAVAAMFLPFLTMVATGIVMITYHIRHTDVGLVLGIGKAYWLLAHKVSTLLAMPLVVWHVLLHKQWLLKFFSRQLKNKHKGANRALLVVYLLSALTALLSWVVLGNTVYADILKGLHSKLGFVLVLLFLVHLKHYWFWIVKMTKKKLFNNGAN